MGRSDQTSTLRPILKLFVIIQMKIWCLNILKYLKYFETLCHHPNESILCLKNDLWFVTGHGAERLVQVNLVAEVNLEVADDDGEDEDDDDDDDDEYVDDDGFEGHVVTDINLEKLNRVREFQFDVTHNVHLPISSF